jgi:hypothetical protein
MRTNPSFTAWMTDTLSSRSTTTDQLDKLLLDAWHDMSNELKQQPWKLARRMERVQCKELCRPVRAWAVALRARDARFGGEDLFTPGGDEGAIERCRRGARISSCYWAVVFASCAKLNGSIGRARGSMRRRSNQGATCARCTGDRTMAYFGTASSTNPVGGARRRGGCGQIRRSTRRRTPRLRDSAKDHRTANDAWPGRYRGWDWLCPGRRIADGTTAGRLVPCGRAAGASVRRVFGLSRRFVTIRCQKRRISHAGRLPVVGSTDGPVLTPHSLKEIST